MGKSSPSSFLKLVTVCLFLLGSAATTSFAENSYRFGLSRFISVNVGASGVAGNQMVEWGHYTSGGIYVRDGSETATNRSLFGTNYYASVGFGVHRPNSRFLVEGDAGIWVIESTRRQHNAWAIGASAPATGSIELVVFSGRVSAMYIFNDFESSAWLPQAGLNLQIGGGNLESISWSETYFAAGPSLALERKLGGWDEGNQFMTVHFGLEYSRSFTDGWPNMFLFTAGLRFYWL